MKVEEAFETNLIEKKEKKLRVENGEVNFDIGPYQIKTIYIR